VVIDYHSLDFNPPDLHISLSELLRGIQLFAFHRYHCSTTSPDGYAVGPGDQSCEPHDLDYNPQNWRIGLSELLRAIQLFAARDYYPCPGVTEDGFCLGTP
jgi:hypothetical protein